MTIQDILSIVIPIFGLLGWIYSRIDKKFDQVEKRFQHMDVRNEQLVQKMTEEFSEMKKILHSLDIRLTRLEGRFEERGYWESRKTGTHDEK